MSRFINSSVVGTDNVGQLTKSAHFQVKRYVLSFVNLQSQELTRVLPEWFSRTHKWCLGVCEIVP